MCWTSINMKSIERADGHLAPWPRLARSWEHGRMGQALLLVGPALTTRPVGDAVTRQLLCVGSGRQECVCRSCQALPGAHPDNTVLAVPAGKKNLPRDAVHGALAAITIRPLWSHARVVRIPDAERLSPEAESYLLKYLEEPPSYATYILETAEPDRLLATIRSRCRIIRTCQPADGSDLLPVEDLLKTEKLAAEDVVRAGYWVRRQYRASGRETWLGLWDTLWRVHGHLEANGNADIAKEVLRHAWIRNG